MKKGIFAFCCSLLRKGNSFSLKVKCTNLGWKMRSLISDLEFCFINYQRNNCEQSPSRLSRKRPPPRPQNFKKGRKNRNALLICTFIIHILPPQNSKKKEGEFAKMWFYLKILGIFITWGVGGYFLFDFLRILILLLLELGVGSGIR